MWWLLLIPGLPLTAALLWGVFWVTRQYLKGLKDGGI